MRRERWQDRERGGVTERTVRVEPKMDDSPRQARPSLNITDTGRERGRDQAVVRNTVTGSRESEPEVGEK